jgi:hypothetical protein
LFIEDGILKVKIANYHAQELNIYDIDTFTSEGNLIRFNRTNRAVIGFDLDAGRVTNLKFERK